MVDNKDDEPVDVPLETYTTKKNKKVRQLSSKEKTPSKITLKSYKKIVEKTKKIAIEQTREPSTRHAKQSIKKDENV